MANVSFKHFLSVAGVLAFGLVAATSFAQAMPPVGSMLSTKELSAVRISEVVQVGKQRYRAFSVAGDVAGANSTLVLNDHDVVGVSYHEVVVSGADTASVMAKTSALTVKAVTSSPSEVTNTVSLRYASFAEAVRARDALEAAFPNASVALPIQFSARKPR